MKGVIWAGPGHGSRVLDESIRHRRCHHEEGQEHVDFAQNENQEQCCFPKWRTMQKCGATWGDRVRSPQAIQPHCFQEESGPTCRPGEKREKGKAASGSLKDWPLRNPPPGNVLESSLTHLVGEGGCGMVGRDGPRATETRNSGVVDLRRTVVRLFYGTELPTVAIAVLSVPVSARAARFASAENWPSASQCDAASPIPNVHRGRRSFCFRVWHSKGKR